MSTVRQNNTREKKVVQRKPRQTKLFGVLIKTLDRAFKLGQLCVKLVNLLQVRLQNFVCVSSARQKREGCKVKKEEKKHKQ